LEYEEISDKTVVCAGTVPPRITAVWKKMPKNLKHIGGWADFRKSQIKELGQLQSISGNAIFFGNSQIKELGQLQSIGGDAYVEENSPLVNLLKSKKIVKGEIVEIKF
ncbi:unnamed protein product, partial [marine sediment metagenome]